LLGEAQAKRPADPMASSLDPIWIIVNPAIS
jgi:hypothetical protein